MSDSGVFLLNARTSNAARLFIVHMASYILSSSWISIFMSLAHHIVGVRNLPWLAFVVRLGSAGTATGGLV